MPTPSGQAPRLKASTSRRCAARTATRPRAPGRGPAPRGLRCRLPSPPEQNLLPPPGTESMGPPPPWMAAPPPPPTSVWQRIAAFVVLIAVVAAVAGAGIGWSLARVVNNRPVAQATTTPETPIQAATPGTTPSAGSGTASAIAAKVDPAIVDINTTVGSSQAAGTGMIISSTGEILTNNHVVSQSTSITVTVQG